MSNPYPGSWVASTNDGKGNINATQAPTSPLTGGPTATIPFNWSSGPLTLSGWIDPVTFNTSIRLTVLDLQLATADVRLYLKNGNEIWVNLNYKALFDRSYTGDYKIISF